MVRRQR